MDREAKSIPMKFSIRDLLLVTVIVALVLGWWVDRQTYIQWGRNLERERERAVWDAQKLTEHLEEIGAKTSRDERAVHTRYEYRNGYGEMSSYFHSSLPTSSAPAPNPPKP
jgi:hypothetical protein